MFSLNIKSYASDNTKARIGNNFYDNLEDAIKNATSKDTITLTGNINLKDTLEINKTVNINLNNKKIEAEEQVFLIQGGSLNLTGTGTIRETKPNYGAIILKGSNDSNKKNFSTVSIGSDIILEGWSGIFINHDNNTAYGILVNMNGTIKSVNDVNGGSGAGIYVNGNIKQENNHPIINLSNTTKITSTGNGIYSAGYATYNINGAYIEGIEAGIGIKSGIFNITNATILGTGEDKTPTYGNNNGINPSGAAIQIESNPGYAGNIELYIKSGTIKSLKSNVIYEYIINNNNGNTEVKKIEISGGKFISDAKKDVFRLSNNLINKHQKFISGGIFSSNPTEYLKSGYNANKNENSMYEVTMNTMKTFLENNENKSNTIWIPVIISLIIIGIITFLNRNKILNLFTKQK